MANFRWLSAVAGLLLGHLCLQVTVAATNPPARTYSVNVWGTGQGLPQNSVGSMVQSRDGYLWFGTQNGLARFDGQRFKVFDENNTPGLNDSSIVHLFEDSRGHLWIGTENAGTVVMRHGRIVVPGKGELSAGGVERQLIAACEDAEGAVWLYNANGELWRHQDGRFQPLLLNSPEMPQPKTVVAERNGPVWVATLRQQFAVGAVRDATSLDLPVSESISAGPPFNRLDLLVPGRRGGYWKLANFQIERWVTNRLVQRLGEYPWKSAGVAIGAACEDHDGNLVVGTRGAGIFWISTNGGVTSLSTNERLANNTVLSLVTDRGGTLWVGTLGGGLNQVKRQDFLLLPETRGWGVPSVSADPLGGVWIGSRENGFGYWKDGATQVFGDLPLSPTKYVRSIFMDAQSRLWVGTRPSTTRPPGLYRGAQNVGAGLIRSEVQAMHQDRRGVMWFGTLAHGLVSWNEREWKAYSSRDGLTSDNITALADDAEGTLWIGTRRGGLNRWRDGKFDAIRKADGLPSDDIASVWIDGQGVVWVTTSTSGLAWWQHGRWSRYTTHEGLISDNLGFILDDEAGNLWLGSNAGLLRVRKKALHELAGGAAKFVACRAYGESDGLPTLECSTGSQPGAARGRDGRLWFPTIKGLVSVDPAQLTPNPTPPLVAIESLLIDDAPVAGFAGAEKQATITLRPGQERLEIHYSSANLSAPEWARFRYRLEGYEKDWNEAGNSRVAIYRKLEPGAYTFHVTACNEDGVWNEAGSTMAVIVQPPFWRTWWFYITSALGLVALVAGIVHYFSTQRLQRQLAQLRQQEALEKERARIARDIHDQVGASLTQVALLGEMVGADKDLPEEVEAHAQQITQAARETTKALDEIVWTVNPANDTLEGLVNYICKHAQDFLAVAGLRYRLEVPTLPAINITPEVRHNVFLASKEAVTNVVRHAKATAAWIRLRLDDGAFTVEIEDNGRGIADPDAPTVRNGLRNMRKRMEDIGGTFAIARGAEGGALVRLTVPLQKSNIALGNKMTNDE